MSAIPSFSRKRVQRAKAGAPNRRRRGAVVVLIAILMIPLLAMVAFAIDYGYLLKLESDLQRSADAAALAAVQELLPDALGRQDLSKVQDALRNYAAANSGQGFQILDADVEIGRYDPATIYTNVTILNTGMFDTVRVTLRRDASANSRVGLFFAPLLGTQDGAIRATATAVLQKAALLPPGADVLPFSVPQDVWDGRAIAEEWSIYGDGKMRDDSGNLIPGNWGTVDIGQANNSTSDQNNQILDGLRQSDLDALHADHRISTNAYINAARPVSLQGDPGLSSGLKHSVQAIHGQTRIVPIYNSNNGSGGNTLDVNVVKWGVVKVIDSTWQGAKNTHVEIAKSYEYQGLLRPMSDLSSTSGYIEGAFTSPVLVE